MDIVVKARKADVSEKFRTHAMEKLTKVERLGHPIMRLEVEVTEERNPRQSEMCHRVEVTCVSKGPVIRAEAAAHDPYAALDIVLGKLQERLRRSADKRRVHHGSRTPASLPKSGLIAPSSNGSAPPAAAASDADAAVPDDDDMPDDGPFIVREKVFPAAPMTLDDALFQMELVGHDFFLFADVDSGLPSVVYRRKGYDYGVIRLKQPDLASEHELAGAGRPVGEEDV